MGKLARLVPRRHDLFISLSTLTLLLVAVFAPPLPGLSPKGQRMVGIMIVAAILWSRSSGRCP